VVRHTAVHALAKLRAEPCLAVLDKADASPTARALQALVRIPESTVVAGVSDRLENEKDAARRAQLITALCRLHFVEGVWKGDSWGTRPDTRGPYYQPEPWSETPRIAALLEATLKQADAAEAIVLGRELARHRIQLGDVVGRLIELARQDPSVVPSLVLYLDREEKVPAAALDLLLSADGANDAKQRLTQWLALRVGCKIDDPTAVDKLLAHLPSMWLSMTRIATCSPARSETSSSHRTSIGNVSRFAEASASQKPPQSLWADGVLIRLAFSAGAAPAAKQAALTAVDEGWKKPDRRKQLIAASEFADDRSLAVRIADDADDKTSPTAQFARETLQRIPINHSRGVTRKRPELPQAAPTRSSNWKLRGEPWRRAALPSSNA
jgi:hypothetical protein